MDPGLGGGTDLPDYRSGGAIVPQIIGIFLGGLSGFFGGWVDMLIMRIIDVGVCIPSLVYVTLIMLWLDAGPVAIIIAIAITGWWDSARVVRGPDAPV